MKNHGISARITRGDLFWADLDPVVGAEQGGIRPVLVLQNEAGNTYSPTVIVAAITSKKNKAVLPTHVAFQVSCLPQESMALLEQIRTIDKNRLRDYIGHLRKDIMARIDSALRISLEQS